MSFNFKHLTEQVRALMLDEVDLDEKSGEMYTGKTTNLAGKAAFAGLLKAAIKDGNEVTLGLSLHPGLFLQKSPRSNGRGGTVMASVPSDANQTLAEGEFNRFYIRAVCRLALDQGCPEVEIYRARRSENPRPESQRLLGKQIDASSLLNDLRNSQGVDTALGCPPGPRSGLSVMLPTAFVAAIADRHALSQA